MIRRWFKDQLLPFVCITMVMFACINMFMLTLAETASDPAASIGSSSTSASLLTYPVPANHNQSPHQLTPQAGRCGVLDALCLEASR